MRVIFRVDAAYEIGSGHVARCRVLADSLQDAHGAKCTFIGRDPDRLAARMLVGSPHEQIVTPEPDGVGNGGAQALPHSHWLKRSQAEDVELCRKLLRDDQWQQSDWLVADHYGMDASWEREFPGHVLAIDDLADRSHAADIVLDQNLRREAWGDYANVLERGVRLLSGPRYALLRPEFRVRTEHEPSVDLFISFGGADTANWTEFAMRAAALLPGVTAHVAVSGRHPALAELRQFAEKQPGFELHVDHDDIAYLMRDSRLAIGAGGGMAWERCSCGLPTLAWAIAGNQRNQLQQLATADAINLADARDLTDPQRLSDRIATLLGDHSRLSAMSSAAQQLCDGSGVDRVIKAMCATSVALRPAVMGDAGLVWEWRNDPEVRATAFDTSEIPWQQHESWFERSLTNPDRLMRLAEWQEKAVGFIRLDRIAEGAEVSIFLAPEMKGVGLAGAILSKVERDIPADWDVEALIAGIRPENGISISLFENAGYVKSGNAWRKQLAPAKRREQ